MYCAGRDVERHPRLGASWEGFALEQTISLIGGENAYYWSAHGGAELNLLIMARGRRYGFEFKHADAPRRTRSMHSALNDLKLEHLWTVYPGSKRYALSENITALPLTELDLLTGELFP